MKKKKLITISNIKERMAFEIVKSKSSRLSILVSHLNE